MKQVIIFTAFIVASFVSIAQGNSFQQKADLSHTTLLQMIEEIKHAADIRTKFILKEAEVDNIEASISHRKKCISYNPLFLENIQSVSQSEWTIVALLAHEIGHHVKGHTNGKKRGERLKLELEADEFAGFVLNKLGATVEQSQEVMHYIARTKPSTTHPARSDRMYAIQKGWNAANADPVNNEVIFKRSR
jgi:hypothetical protein